jgi:hypothetical protein
MAMSFPIVMDCQPDHGGEPVPHALHFGLASVAVKTLMDSWAGRDHRYFKLLGEDGATYIVRHDLPSGLWELAFHDHGQESAW